MNIYINIQEKYSNVIVVTYLNFDRIDDPLRFIRIKPYKLLVFINLRIYWLKLYATNVLQYEIFQANNFFTNKY